MLEKSNEMLNDFYPHFYLRFLRDFALFFHHSCSGIFTDGFSPSKNQHCLLINNVNSLVTPSGNIVTRVTMLGAESPCGSEV